MLKKTNKIIEEEKAERFGVSRNDLLYEITLEKGFCKSYVKR